MGSPLLSSRWGVDGEDAEVRAVGVDHEEPTAAAVVHIARDPRAVGGETPCTVVAIIVRKPGDLLSCPIRQEDIRPCLAHLAAKDEAPAVWSPGGAAGGAQGLRHQRARRTAPVGGAILGKI